MKTINDTPMKLTEAATAATVAPCLFLDGSRRLGHDQALAPRCFR